MKEKKKRLNQMFERYAKEDMCLAFSGGVDSSLILKVASEAAARTGRMVYAVTFDSRLHPVGDLEDAKKVAKELGGIHKIISINELEQEGIRNNPVNRCYLCKKYLFQALIRFAESKGISNVFDGTNEDDMHVYRPGIHALKELGVISPLADLHITKKEVKEIAREYGISVANRPSAPCMATRIPYDTNLDFDILEKIAEGEAYIRSYLGGNIRLRLHKDVIRIETDLTSFPELLKIRENVTEKLKSMGFVYITLDLEGFRSGSMDVYVNGNNK